MGILDILRATKWQNNQFLKNQHFKSNLVKQMETIPQTMRQLRKLNIAPHAELKLDYFFYTNTLDKATDFATEIKKMNYQVDYGQSSKGNKNFMIAGKTTKMKMEDKTIKDWARKMCELGYKFDCDFAGWGTSPEESNQ